MNELVPSSLVDLVANDSFLTKDRDQLTRPADGGDPGRTRHRLWRHRNQPALRLQGSDQGGQRRWPPRPEAVLGAISLIIWSLILVVSLKYAILILRADNRSEGGIVALLALLRARAPRPAARHSHQGYRPRRPRSRRRTDLTVRSPPARRNSHADRSNQATRLGSSGEIFACQLLVPGLYCAGFSGRLATGGHAAMPLVQH